jgi:hypothetical protein
MAAISSSVKRASQTSARRGSPCLASYLRTEERGVEASVLN